MSSHTSTWSAAIADTAMQFERVGIADAQTNAEYLAMHILRLWKKDELHNYLSKSLTQDQSISYQELLARRLTNEPLQHIIGETEFFGLRLFASPAALIPRPDTEILVEEILKESSFLKKQLHILDIGTGSGAIALALASKLSHAKILGIDISSDAIALANENKARLKIENVFFEAMDIFQDEGVKFSASFGLIVSNPPYISASEFETLEPEVRDFDPRIALTDEGDGLSFYRRIAEIAPKLLNENGRVLVEVGYNAVLEVEKIFVASGFDILRRVKDLQGIERVLVIERCAS